MPVKQKPKQKLIRTNVPDFLFKHVTVTKLEAAQNCNGNIGLVKEWSEKREQFSVQLICDDSQVWIKPSNLNYFPNPQNAEETELFEVIYEKQSDVNFEQGIKLFDQLSAPEKYMPTFLKIFLCHQSLISMDMSMQNKNCMSQIQDVLKKIIKNSCFYDLIVRAKLSLAFSMNMVQTMENRSIIFDLCYRSIENNFGHLPTIFKNIVDVVFRHPSEWQRQNGAVKKFQMLQNLYFKTKEMIKNKTFVNLNRIDFLEGSLLFFRISKYFEHGSFWDLNKISIKRETDFLLEVLDFLTPNLISDRYFYHAKILFLQENYEEALNNFQLFQEIMASKYGNNKRVGTAYKQKAECYIKLGKKSMAKQVLKKLKRFDHLDVNSGPVIDDLEKRIKAMHTGLRPRQKNKNVRTPTKCSSYTCMKIEPYVGAFKNCARCRMTYYCSKKCQRLHWKSSHKADCKEY